MPLKSFISLLKSIKVSCHLLLLESAYKQICESTSQLKCDFWDVTEAVVDAEGRLEFQKVIGYHQISRAGFGSFKSSSIPRSNLTIVEDLFPTCYMKLMKMHIKLNLYISICRATGLNGVIL